MFFAIHPKLPMRNKAATKDFYVNKLGFRDIGAQDLPAYMMLMLDRIEIHFFLFADLDPKENYGQVYIRTTHIDDLYLQLQKIGVAIHPNGQMQVKPWRQKEFSILDPDNNLLTFGEAI